MKPCRRCGAPGDDYVGRHGECRSCIERDGGRWWCLEPLPEARLDAATGLIELRPGSRYGPTLPSSSCTAGATTTRSTR